MSKAYAIFREQTTRIATLFQVALLYFADENQEYKVVVCQRKRNSFDLQFPYVIPRRHVLNYRDR